MAENSIVDPLLRGQADNIYPNAFFDYLTKLLPKQLKVLFIWLEYLYVNSGSIFGTLKKFSEYPITELQIDAGENKKLKERMEDVLEKKMKLRPQAIEVGLDYNIYGNSFTSLYKPFVRYLVCKKCGNRHNAKHTTYQWQHSTFQFLITCSQCGHKGAADVQHTKSTDASKLKIIRWDAKFVNINCNPVTEEKEYYYEIPESIVSRLKNKNPDKFLLDTLPWEFIQTIKEKKIFKFAEGQIFHMAAPAPAGINKEWGFPGLLSAMKPFFYTAILRKANEAIALEHIVPMRVLFPQGTTANNDPTQYISMSKWRDEMEGSIKKWRRDQNHIKFSPIPLGVQNMGGDGRAMLTIAEVQAAEESIISSMGVPKEFLYGGMSDRNGSVNLRMLENQFLTYTDQMKEWLQWVTDQVADFMQVDRVKISMTPFKLIDDIQQKQTAIQLGLQAQLISKSTAARLLDQDIVEERKKMVADSIEEAKMQAEMQDKMQKVQNALSNQIKSQQSQNPLNYDANAVMQVAQEQAMQLIQIPMEQRKSQLLGIMQQDPVLHACVVRVLSQMHKTERQQGAGSVAAGADPMAGASAV